MVCAGTGGGGRGVGQTLPLHVPPVMHYRRQACGQCAACDPSSGPKRGCPLNSKRRLQVRWTALALRCWRCERAPPVPPPPLDAVVVHSFISVDTVVCWCGGGQSVLLCMATWRGSHTLTLSPPRRKSKPLRRHPKSRSTPPCATSTRFVCACMCPLVPLCCNNKNVSPTRSEVAGLLRHQYCVTSSAQEWTLHRRTYSTAMGARQVVLTANVGVDTPDLGGCPALPGPALPGSTTPPSCTSTLLQFDWVQELKRLSADQRQVEHELRTCSAALAESLGGEEAATLPRDVEAALPSYRAELDVFRAQLRGVAALITAPPVVAAAPGSSGGGGAGAGHRQGLPSSAASPPKAGAGKGGSHRVRFVGADTASAPATGTVAEAEAASGDPPGAHHRDAGRGGEGSVAGGSPLRPPASPASLRRKASLLQAGELLLELSTWLRSFNDALLDAEEDAMEEVRSCTCHGACHWSLGRARCLPQCLPRCWPQSARHGVCYGACHGGRKEVREAQEAASPTALVGVWGGMVTGMVGGVWGWGWEIFCAATKRWWCDCGCRCRGGVGAGCPRRRTGGTPSSRRRRPRRRGRVRAHVLAAGKPSTRPHSSPRLPFPPPPSPQQFQCPLQGQACTCEPPTPALPHHPRPCAGCLTWGSCGCWTPAVPRPAGTQVWSWRRSSACAPCGTCTGPTWRRRPLRGARGAPRVAWTPPHALVRCPGRDWQLFAARVGAPATTARRSRHPWP
jgi:hypothetical protein